MAGDPSPLFRPGEIHLECWVQFWAPQYKKDMDMLETDSRRGYQAGGELEHVAMREC